jgi:hypothetical protein
MSWGLVADSELDGVQAGITNAALASVGVQVMNVLMTVVAAYLMDRAGRKQLLTFSFRCEHWHPRR